MKKCKGGIAITFKKKKINQLPRQFKRLCFELFKNKIIKKLYKRKHIGRAFIKKGSFDKRLLLYVSSLLVTP